MKNCFDGLLRSSKLLSNDETACSASMRTFSKCTTHRRVVSPKLRCCRNSTWAGFQNDESFTCFRAKEVILWNAIKFLARSMFWGSRLHMMACIVLNENDFEWCRGIVDQGTWRWHENSIVPIEPGNDWFSKITDTERNEALGVVCERLHTSRIA